MDRSPSAPILALCNVGLENEKPLGDKNRSEASRSPDRPGRNRTCNPRFWRPVLYQLSYGPKLLRRGWLTGIRSEEHTSELQSLAYLVCRLLLEKKKKKSTN